MPSFKVLVFFSTYLLYIYWLLCAIFPLTCTFKCLLCFVELYNTKKYSLVNARWQSCGIFRTVSRWNRRLSIPCDQHENVDGKTEQSYTMVPKQPVTIVDKYMFSSNN